MSENPEPHSLTQFATERSEKRSSCCRWLSGFVLLAALAYALWQQTRPDGLARQALTAAIKRDVQPIEVGELADFDVFYEGLRGAGNLFLQFKGLDPESTYDTWFAGQHYFRSSYLLYPQRIYVTGQPVPITYTKTLLPVNHLPSTAWLQAHEVTLIITFEKQGQYFITRSTPVTGAPP